MPTPDASPDAGTGRGVAVGGPDGQAGSDAVRRLVSSRRPFTRAQGLAAGLSPALLRSARFRSLFRGVYVAFDAPDTLRLRAAGALLLHPPDAFVSHSSAARFYGLFVPATSMVDVSVRRAADRRTRSGISCHLAPPAVTVCLRQGVPVSSVIDTFVALASVLGLVDLVAVGDAMVRAKLVEPEGLEAGAAKACCRGAALARRAASFVRCDVDSPMESRLRTLIVLAGLPEPKVNHPIQDHAGRTLVRLDLSYPGLKLIIEYDGRQHADSTQQWLHDLDRREMLDELGWRLIVVTAEGIFRHPDRTVERVAKALEAAGRRDLAQHVTPAWRHYFPV